MARIINEIPRMLTVMMNITRETELSFPEYALVLPKSLNQLAQKEYPGALGTTNVPPV